MSEISINSSDYIKTINALTEATTYEQSRPCLSGRVFTQNSFAVNNLEIYPFLSRKLNRDDFQKMFLLAEEKGVFNLTFQHGIPSVTEAAGAKHMTRKWPRDAAGMTELIKNKYPDEFVAGLLAIAAAYCSKTEQDAFGRVLLNPSCFKQNDGIAHVFWQRPTRGTLYRDKKWSVNQRIESHAEFLGVLAEYISSSQNKPQPIPAVVIKTTTYLIHYLYCLGISPQTCGPWEEIPFPKGSNWDSASVVLAFEKVQQMIKRLTEKQKKRFFTAEKRLCQKFGRTPLLSAPHRLAAFCKKSTQFIQQNYMDEFRGCTNHDDAASVMLAASDICLDNDIIQDIQKRLHILERFELKLLGKFGARRYGQFQISLKSGNVDSCDSYLQKNYNILIDNADLKIKKSKKDWIDYQENEGNDASKADGFNSRAQNCDEQSSAQWGLPVSYAAIAFAKMVKRLKKLEKQTAESENLLRICLKGQEYYIKRCYASISGYRTDGSIPFKADGTTSIPWRKPEAYQAVSFYGHPEKWGFVPGVNSHLGWDAAKCWEASCLVLENLQNETDTAQ